MNKILLSVNTLLTIEIVKGGCLMAGFIVAIISGALMSLQGVLNTNVTKASSIWVAAGFVQHLQPAL